MKVFPVAILVLLAFAAFFMTFLVAPLAVLTIFYVAYSMRAAKSDSGPLPPGDAAEAPRPWAAEDEPVTDEEPAATPARRGRITVESHRERAAAAEAAAAEEAAREAELEHDSGSQTATVTTTETVSRTETSTRSEP